MTDKLIESGIAAYHQGQKQQAIGIFSSLLKEEPDFTDAWFWLGRCMDDPDKARYCYERAAASNPNLVTRDYILVDAESGGSSRPFPLAELKAVPVETPAAKPPVRAKAEPPQHVKDYVEEMAAFIPARPAPVVPESTPIPPVKKESVDAFNPFLGDPGDRDPQVSRKPQRTWELIGIFVIALLVGFLLVATPGFLLVTSGMLDRFLMGLNPAIQTMAAMLAGGIL